MDITAVVKDTPQPVNASVQPGMPTVAGKDGVSCTHYWDGTVLTITSAAGTSSADLKGDTGATGPRGEKGDTGATGPQGEKGDKPVKGVDYFTDADKEDMVDQVGQTITPADIGAAPGGYGLGEAKSFSMADIDTIVRPGFYSSNGTATIGGFTTSRWWMLVKAYGNGTYFVTQEIYTFSGALGLKLERHKVNGNWLEWEWVNPPMVVGVEYRTTERYNGSPVYTKLVELGNLPNASTKDVQFTDDARNVFPISLEPQIGSGIANLHTTLTDDFHVMLVNYRYVRVATTVDRSNMVGRAIVKYYYN